MKRPTRPGRYHFRTSCKNSGLRPVLAKRCQNPKPVLRRSGWGTVASRRNRKTQEAA